MMIARYAVFPIVRNIYIRVSTAMQVEGYSLEAQKERLTKFAAFQEMEVVREYCEM